MKPLFKTILMSLLSVFGLNACNANDHTTTVIQNFELNRYLGTWYEIARLDHSFERGLSKVTANYSLRPDGKVKVVNRGFKESKNTWSESVGKAKFAGIATEGKLKVSFFGPFYGAYNIISLDENYQYALVVSTGTKYMWLLSRNTSIPNDIKNSYLQKAQEFGIDIDKLIWVTH